MSIGQNKNICVVLLAMGGPNKTDDIPKYLYNIFSDRSLIKLPGGPLFQKPLARIISMARSPKVKARYNLIGGGSPLFSWTKKQANQIEEKLSHSFSGLKCFVAMRYFDPYIYEVMSKIYDEEYDQIIFLPMYPQYSKATTGSCFDEIKKVQKLNSCNYSFIKDFHSDGNYIALMQKYIDDNIKEDEVLLFSAHALPQEFVDDGDPYVDQIKTTAKLAANGREYFVSFQSRTGPVNWVGPDTIETAGQLLDKGKSIFVVPISFVCDHIETLYEIDIELEEELGEKAQGRIKRMPMFNDDPKFSEVLVNLIDGVIKQNVSA
ncbi:MAG: ferrochelatase [Candidatus Zixiibacteriota bacterium]|nr:MAG: ferrochelatase [candidate division Zixibacteria bacterium]